MADTKVTGLTELTIPAITDMLYVVDDPSGTPLSKKIEIGNLLGLEFGQVYTSGGTGTQTPGTAYVKLTQFDTNGLSSSTITPDATNNKITVTNTGHYFVYFQASFAGSSNAKYNSTLYWNGVVQAQGGARRGMPSGNALPTSFACFVDVTTGATDFEVYIKSDTAGKIYDVKEAQLLVVRVGAT